MQQHSRCLKPHKIEKQSACEKSVSSTCRAVSICSLTAGSHLYTAALRRKGKEALAAALVLVMLKDSRKAAKSYVVGS